MKRITDRSPIYVHSKRDVLINWELRISGYVLFVFKNLQLGNRVQRETPLRDFVY